MSNRSIPVDPMMVNFITAYESDQLNEEQIIKGFQRLIDSGLVWHLQGTYGRTASELIAGGHCHGTSLTGLAKQLSTDDGRGASGLWDFGPDPTLDFDIPGE